MPKNSSRKKRYQIFLVSSRLETQHQSSVHLGRWLSWASPCHANAYPIELMDIAFHTKVNRLLCVWPSTTLEMVYYLLHIKIWRNKDASKREIRVCISNQVIQEKSMEAKEKKAPSFKCGSSRQLKRSRPQPDTLGYEAPDSPNLGIPTSLMKTGKGPK